MADLFDSFDVLATVSQPIRGHVRWISISRPDLSFPDPLGAIGNLCGLPALCRFPAASRTNIYRLACSSLARAGDDFGAIQAARTFQSHTDWHRRHPKLS